MILMLILNKIFFFFGIIFFIVKLLRRIRIALKTFILKKKSQLIYHINQFLLVKILLAVFNLFFGKYFEKTKEQICKEKVFNNPYLVEKIVRKLEKRYYLVARKVNKTFNSAVLGILRKDNRIMKIEFMQCVHNILANNWLIVHINLLPFDLSVFVPYIRFLNEVAGLQVEQIEVIDSWKLNLKPEKNLAKKFHEDIHSLLIGNNQIKSLIGLEDLSNNCSHCVEIARRCMEYGPIDLSWMQTNFGKHFEKIVLTDVFLDQLSNSCVSDTQSKEDCYQMLEDHFARPNISCTSLLLCVHESRDTDNTGMHQDHTPIPWEVLEMALKKWNVQKIEIKIIRNWKHMPHIETWSQSNCFTGIRFNDAVENLKDLKVSQKLTDAHLDLSLSLECIKDLKLQRPPYGYRGYENVIANIRRIFNPDQISINFTHWLLIEPSNPQEVLENLLRISRLGYHQNLLISFKLHLKIENVIGIPEEFKALGPLRPSYRNVMNSKDKPYFFETEKWVGELYRFVDLAKNFSLDAELFITEKNLKKVTLEHLQTAVFMDMFQPDIFE